MLIDPLLLALVAQQFVSVSARHELAPIELHVCCGCGSDLSTRPDLRATPLNTLREVKSLIRSFTREEEEDITIFVSGICASPGPFTFADGGKGENSRVTYRSYPGETPGVISGGVSLFASQVTPVTDPSIVNQIPATARPFVVQVTLSDLGITDLGKPQCHPYMGGEASILPGNLVSAALEVFLYGDPTIGGDLSPLTLARWPNKDHLPKQWASGNINNYTIYVDNTTETRLPGWAEQLQYDPGSAFVHYLGGLGWNDHHNLIADVSLVNASAPCCANCSNFESGFDYDGNDLFAPIPATSQADCCAKCTAQTGCNAYSFCTNDNCGATNCYLKNSSLGRKPWPDRLSGPHVPTPEPSSITLAPCPSLYQQPGFDSLDNAGTFYAYNLLSELDSEGEFYVNRTSGMLYMWPPASASSPYWQVSPWGKPVVSPVTLPRTIDRTRLDALLHRVAGTEVQDAPIGELSTDVNLLDMEGTAYLTLDGLVLTTARNAGIKAVNTTSIRITNCILQNFGSMAINATGGIDFVIDSSTVRHAGNGAIFFYAGDRVLLVDAGHTVRNCTVSYSNRYMYCYVPMVALADCGNAIDTCELFGGPHQGTFISGNEHSIINSQLHDLVEAASDSGVVYMGRDWTYRGNLIANNTFTRINTADPGDDVSAVYLDDEVSGFTITGNVFINVSRALLLGGGRDNIFSDNAVAGVEGGDGAVHFDNRGMGWASGSCTGAGGELVQFLNRVPYNTSAVWIARYPHLPEILADEPCVPKYNVIVGNTYCGMNGKEFIDQPNATIATWGSTAWNNTAC